MSPHSSRKAKVDKTRKKGPSFPFSSTGKSHTNNHLSHRISYFCTHQSSNEHARKLMLLSCYH